MWRVSDDFSGTRISYGYKLWLIAWMLLTDWTFWWNWIPESPKQCDEIDRLDVVGRNKTWKVQTDAPERADWTLEAETGLEKSKPTHQSWKIGHNKQEHASQSPKQRQLHTPPKKKYYKKL